MLLINLNNLDEHDIADVDDVRDLFDALIGKFGDMNHTVFAGSKVDGCAKLTFVVLHDLGDFAFIHVADFDVAADILDDGASLADCNVVARCDEDHTLVVDIDFHAGIFDDLVDGLSARADDVADLIGID